MKTIKNDSAYPIIIDNITKYQIRETGLTKREYFAAMAMQGMLSNSKESDPSSEWVLSYATRHEIAKMSVEQADALVAELNKEIK